jgi:DNA invertase Pin-like site-specific DNA recombinase
MGLAIIYSRQSDPYGGAKGEGEDGLSVEAQTAACREHAAKLGLAVHQEYQEQFSGLSEDRPVYKRLMEDVRRNVKAHKKGDPCRITALVIYKWSRLSRDPDLVVPLVGYFRQQGIEIEPVADRRVGDSEMERMMLYIISTFNQIQVKDGIEHASRARKQLWDTGKLVCTGKARYGYKYDKDSHARVIDEDAAAIVRRIFAWFTEGLAAHAVMVKLRDEGVKSPSGRPRWGLKTIRDIIKDPSYKGEAMRVQKTERTPLDEGGGYHPCGSRKFRKAEGRAVGEATPAIVSAEVWDRANEMASGRHRAGVRGEPDWLVGRVFCASCGVRLGKFKHTRGYSYWRCPRHQNFKECDIKMGHALDKYIREDAERNLARFMNDDRLLDAKIAEWEATMADPNWQAEHDRNRAELDKLKGKMARLLARFGDDPDLEDLLAGQIHAAQDRIKALEAFELTLAARVAQVGAARENGKKLRACLIAFKPGPHIDAMLQSENSGIFIALMPHEDRAFLADATGVRVEVGRPTEGKGVTVTVKIFDFEATRAYSSEPLRGRNRGRPANL